MSVTLLRNIIGLASALGIAGAASAMPVQLQATSLSATVSSFEITFDDQIGDGLFRLGELTAFSGVDFPCDPGCGVHETTIVAVPAIAGVTAGSGVSWGFGNATGGGSIQAAADSSLWRYQVSAIPEPPASWTALAGAAVLAAVVRRRRVTCLREASPV